jgi:ribokinase
MKNKRIIVVGSSNTDLIIKLDRLPRPGETIIGGEFASAAGGKGANQAVAAARAGGDIVFIAKVGMDDMGEQAMSGLVEEGIDVNYVFRDPKSPSGVALIFVDKNGENSIAVASGANSKLDPAHVTKAAKLFGDAGVLVLQLETPMNTVQKAVALATQAGVMVFLNPAPARPLPDELLQQISVITPNETEAEMLTGIAVQTETDAAKAADNLLARGVKNVVITLGARGAFVAGNSTRRLIPPCRVKAVDTTGAGDVFNGALAVALTEDKPLLEAVRFACAAAAISVTRLGAQTSAPTREEIERMLSPKKASRPLLQMNEMGA